MDLNDITAFLNVTDPHISYIKIPYGTNISFFGTTASKKGSLHKNKHLSLSKCKKILITVQNYYNRCRQPVILLISYNERSKTEISTEKKKFLRARNSGNKTVQLLSLKERLKFLSLRLTRN